MTKKKNKTYNSPLIDSILEDDSNSTEYDLVKNRMLLASRIKKQMSKLGLTNLDLAKELGRSPSLISKWLSGTHNFTANTLFEIQRVIKIDLINNCEEKLVKPRYELNISFSKEDETISVSPNYMTQNNLNKLPVKSRYEC
ncbi:helix-turn-helix transcriptional regulator [Seonamhaeicola sp.]|uniref:helix-turn-helix domain-containing protein n=1 Tax=Seonamhaeicola sp. TaxID=1912245 RepID=UPI002619BABC|nr:helix-turn-helix transcriptional regulator [Seonamhaeicola sp.]